MNNILLDVASLDEGIPPLSQSNEAVIQMIRSMNCQEKRKTLRKIKKLCKRFMAADLQHKTATAKGFRKNKVEKRLGFNRDHQLFKKDILSMRISCVRSFMIKKLYD